MRRARKHTLVFKYEALMKNWETILELQTRFTHIVNYLLGQGKTCEDEELNIKILNCLTRTSEPKLKVIKESKNLATMAMEAFFAKLLAYEHEQIHQSYIEETEKKVRTKNKEKLGEMQKELSTIMSR